MIVKIKKQIIDFIIKYPAKTLIFIFVLCFIIGFLMTVTFRISYINGKFDFSLNKKELDLKEMKKIRK